MSYLRGHGFAACAVALAVLGCGKEEPSTDATGKPTVAGAQKVVEEKVTPYTYPAPVKGHFKEINVGEFDLVDGIAYPAPGGAGTVVYVTEKPIASPMITDSACPMTQARALTKLRNARFLEVTLLQGRSKYFAAGTPFSGSSRESSPNYWSSRMTADPGRAIGGVIHRQHGSFDFDLPLSNPKVNEVSEADWRDGRRGDATAPKPTEQAVTAAYRVVHDAAVKKNLKALLAALGFDAKQVAAIRGLDGIDADLMVYSDWFLTPGTASEFRAKPGTANVRVEAVNSKGKPFANTYNFASCGDHLVLDGIFHEE
ncbi:MAG TPA: hypothetical protein VG429_07155 [Casimicrobiaceae bacterium]|jgi:hypothetical protein|nr:hypothetical protein [Casimicrobiaceae bacterium]